MFVLNYQVIMHQSDPAAPIPPPPDTVGHLPAFSVLGVGHLQILHCPRAFVDPELFPSF